MSALLEPTPAATEAAREIARRTGRAEHAATVVLGSGWSGVVDRLTGEGSEPVTLPSASLPGFAPPTAAGHAGTVTSCLFGGSPVLLVAGRTHLYEGLGTEPVAHPVHVAAATGCRTVLLTNAAGGLRESMTVGDLVLIADHLDLARRSPLRGAVFVDLVDAYSPALRAAASRALEPVLGRAPEEGVYAQMPGPQYETPAEIRMLRTLGADLVGMSTVPETVAARSLGLDVLAFSLVTNLAAGITGAPLDHTEVLAAGRAGVDRLASALAAVLPAVLSGPRP